jgi:hypothetical protein
MSRFQPHGTLTAHVAGKVLYFESTGPFNAEVVDAVVRAYQPLLQQLADAGPYGHISVFHRSMLATPDALHAFDGLLAEWRHSGLAPVANAYVAADDVEGRNVMMPVFAQVFAGFSPFRDFRTVEEAEQWVGDAMTLAAR